MRIFNGLAREHLAKQRAQALSPTGRPTHLNPHQDGSFAKLITCPKCGGKGLPLHNSTDAAWTAQCLKCAAMFAFHEKGSNPVDAILNRGGIRDRAIGIRETRLHGKRILDANAYAEAEAIRRDVGHRRAGRLGL